MHKSSFTNVIIIRHNFTGKGPSIEQTLIERTHTGAACVFSKAAVFTKTVHKTAIPLILS